MLLLVTVAVVSTPAHPGLAAAQEQGSCAAAVAASLTLCLINRERAAYRRPPLMWQPELGAMALRHSEDMIGRRFFSHVAPNGEDLTDRVDQSSYVSATATWRVGEVLAWATEPSDAPADIVAAWLNSPPHRRVLLDSRFRDIGVGVVAGVPVDGVEGRGATYTAELAAREFTRAAVLRERVARAASIRARDRAAARMLTGARGRGPRLDDSCDGSVSWPLWPSSPNRLTRDAELAQSRHVCVLNRVRTHSDDRGYVRKPE